MGSNNRVKILVVDNHPLYREGLCYILQKLDAHITIYEISNFDGALKCIAENTDMDLVLLGLNFPDKGGFSVLDIITNKYSIIPVVILSASEEVRYIEWALNSGAKGYIS